MKYGLHIPNFGAFGTAQIMAEIARDAELAGWDGFFIWDHVARPIISDLVDPWIAMTAIAMTTESIQFGPMVTPLPRRRPQVLARETASLDVLSGGRLILGVGLGSGRPQEWDAFDEETDMKVRASMTDEALDVLAGLWSGEVFSYHGQHYSVQQSQFLPQPASKPRIPVWVAGYHPYKAPMRRAAKWDGMFILFKDVDDSPAALRETVSTVMALRETEDHFDVVFMSPDSPSAPLSQIHDTIGQAADAGATWWLQEMVPEEFGGARDGNWQFESMHDYIKQGPPRIE